MNKAFIRFSDGEEAGAERQHCMGNELLDFLPYEESVGGESWVAEECSVDKEMYQISE